MKFFKNEWKWFTGLLAIGVTAILLTQPLMGSFRGSNGKPLLAFYFPLPIAMLYLAGCYWQGIDHAKTILPALLLFILLLFPMVHNWFSAYEYQPQDDGFRYRMMATYIARHHTLWGADDLLFNTHRKVYMVQPGYRYYLAAWISIFGKETRLYQFFNMLVYLLASAWLLHTIKGLLMPERLRKGWCLFLVLSSLFVVKLILMGLMEWLVIALFMLVVACYRSHKITWTVLLLALLPFLRQNLLVFSLLLGGWIIVSQKNSWRYALLYVAIVLLPLYHNLYYAGQWKFLSTYYNAQGYLLLDFDGAPWLAMLKTFFYHLALYAGVDWLLPNFWANLLSLLFIPLGSYLYVCAICFYRNRWYVMITLAAIIPTLLLGGRAYYPRFEWVNLSLALLTTMLMFTKQRSQQPALPQQAN